MAKPRHGWWLIPGDPRALRYPDRCACCDAETRDRWDVVPYCAVCRAHVRWNGTTLSIAVAGLGSTYAMRLLAPFAGLVVHVTVVVATLLAVGWAWVVVRRKRRIGPPHTAAVQCAEIAQAGLLARSHAWAARVAADNAVGLVPRSSGYAALERLLPVLAAAASIALVVWWFPRWHLELWIDNGTAAPVVVRADGHTIAELAVGETTRVAVPDRPLELTTDTGDPGDHVTLDPAVGAQWVFNVGQRHCYELRAGSFGTGVNLAPPPRSFRSRLFAFEADYVFEPLPASIVVDKPAGSTTFPTTRRALVIVPCH